MGWRDRDWARLDESERRVLYGRRSLRLRTTRGRRALWVCASAVVALVVGTYATGLAQPVVGAAAARIRTATKRVNEREFGLRHGHHVRAIGGGSTATVGARYTIRGRTGGVNTLRYTGAVVLEGKWDDGSWLTFDRTETDSEGRYYVATTLSHRGTLRLRLVTPDGYIGVKTLVVR